MTNNAPITILLATYNGEKYLDEQIRSLLTQTYDNIRIIVRDDGSTDRTPTMLASWAESHPEKLSIISDGRGNLRWRENFACLLGHCDTPYFALCDQDDVWLPTKVEVLLREIRRLEARAGQVPILVHSDLKVVDADLAEISPSFFRHWHVNVERARRLDHLIINNFVVGCSLAGNKALLDLSHPLPATSPAHDWWLALVAASCGILRTIPEATLLYRQHGKNQIGAGAQKSNILWDARYILRRPRTLKARMASALILLQAQAHVLLDRFGDRMSSHDREFLRAFCLPSYSDPAYGSGSAKKLILCAKTLAVYSRALPRALRWCF